MEINDKVAIVTGASKGIGRVTALGLAKAGADLAISARSRDLLAEVADQVRDMGRKVLSYAGDMRLEQETQEFIRKTVEVFGRIDILVNNAGAGYFSPVTDMSTEQWDEMFNLNVRAAFIATRQALPHLRRAGESVVVNVVSLAGKNAFVGGGGYAASKHALLGFSRCLMLEERKNGVRVLAICPGSVDTHFFDGQQDRMNPNLERALKPEDIAGSIIHMIRLPQRAMLSELDIRPSDPG
jgi:NADP-dependent 3-hydroxy acid dehydrogenase YdfG